MQPSLSVAYRSSAGEGFLGVGFTLGGLSTIARCPSTLAEDGLIRPVKYDEADHLCLDGVRLVQVGASFDFDGSATREYRTIPDTLVKVVAHYPAGAPRSLGPEHFEVFAKSGRIREYGGKSDARAMATGGVVAAWWVSKERDRHDNEIVYTYHNARSTTDGHTLEIVPVRIAYAFDAGDLPGRAVRFTTVDEPSPVISYTGGMRRTRSKRLSRIDMLTEPDDVVVRSYQFDYELSAGTGRQMLGAVRECAGGDGPCKPATRLAWNSHPSAGFVKTSNPQIVLDDEYGHRERATWTLADVNGDGLDDIVFSHPKPSDSGLDEWWVALNANGSFATPKLWATFPYPTSPGPWDMTPLDVDHDGLIDIFLDAQNTDWPTYRYLRATPQHTFELRDTGIPHPARIEPDVDWQVYVYRFMRLGDVNGDGKADLIQCVDEGWEGDYQPHWTVHLWSPSLPGGPGFESIPRVIPNLDGDFGCGFGKSNTFVADVDSDGIASLIVPFSDNNYGALRLEADGTWSTRDFPFLFFNRFHVDVGTRFLDVNGDGLSDVVMTGLLHERCPQYEGGPIVDSGETCGQPGDLGAWRGDQPFRFVNNGMSFNPIEPTLTSPVAASTAWTDKYGSASLALDYNGDGRMDLMMAVDGTCGSTGSTDYSSDPCWVVLQSSPSGEGPMTPINTGIPAIQTYNGYRLLPFGLPKITDVNGDGRHDIVGPDPEDRARFVVYTNDGPQDLLASITEGTAPLDPGDAGFVPTIEIGYGNLVDSSITKEIDPSSPQYDGLLYVSRADPANDCAYPRSCVKGSGRVVRSFFTANGRNEQRHFFVKYRDGRVDYRGRGFLGFGEKLVVDGDTASGAAEFYDNVTYDPVRHAYPYAGHVVRSWTWSGERPSWLDPGRVEITFGEQVLVRKVTNAGATYLVLPEIVRTTREEGTMVPSLGRTVLRFVRDAWMTPLSVIGSSERTVLVRDDYGNVSLEREVIDGADLETRVTRVHDNDPAEWLIGLARNEQTCSAAYGMTQCRTVQRDYNGRGDVDSVWVGDIADPDTYLSLSFAHDARGHVVRSTANDSFGHHRESCVSYDSEGIFPYAAKNGLGHTVYGKFDRGLGVMTAAADVNGLVTRYRHDGFGRLTEELHPDGTTSTLKLSRDKQGGPNGTWWNVKLTAREAGGVIRTTELDSAGRPVRALTVAAMVEACGASKCSPALQLEEEVHYDFYGRVEREILPWMSDDSLTGQLHRDYEYDFTGRLTKQTDPWGRITTYAHAGNVDQATDWLGTTTVQRDAVGRPISVTDKKGISTHNLYGPFGAPRAVIGPGGIRTSEPDAFGRVLREIDPDRGLTEMAYDGFGALRSIDDAANRHYDFDYDSLGRLVRRADSDGVTTWEYDTAPNGIGKLAAVTNAGSVKAYSYNTLSLLESVGLAVDEEKFFATFTYDAWSRPLTTTYPAVPGMAPLAVTRDYDAYGNLIRVRDADDNHAAPYWELTGVDGAGRVTRETLGNGATSERSYRPETGLLTRIRTSSVGSSIQDLAYAYDASLRMRLRADNLQTGPSGVRTELFRHDALGRLTCTEVTDLPATAQNTPPLDRHTCDVSIEYGASGNILRKTDVGDYTYDPQHPHAVLTAGNGTFGYDAVGNQTQRQGAMIAYTSFDLPSTVALGADQLIQFSYDGEQRRIKKSTPDVDTLYFEGVYQRERRSGSPVVHRFFVEAGSASLVITRRAGEADQLAYVHSDALGSADAVSLGSGAAAPAVQRSYDAFGAQRNPKWGLPLAGTPAPSSLGYTGHEDDELGLVNMRGRIYDPKIGRFLQMDPHVGSPHFSQSWNPYSYVLNSPLNFVDPTGFDVGIYTYSSGSSATFPVAPVPYTIDSTGVPLGPASPNAGTRDPNWAPVRNSVRDDTVAQGAQGVPQAVREGSPFAGGSMGVMEGARSLDAVESDQSKFNRGAEAFSKVIDDTVKGAAVVICPAYAIWHGGEKVYSRVTQERALALVTLHPVWELGTGIYATGRNAMNAVKGDPEAIGATIGQVVASVTMTVAGNLGSSGAARAAASSEVVLDANAITGMFERLDRVAMETAMNGRTPVVPPQAAKEFMRGAPGARSLIDRLARAQKLRFWLLEHGGRIGARAGEARAIASQIAAGRLGRRLSIGDARVLATAEQEGLPLLTRDRQLKGAAEAFNLPVETY